MAEKQTRRSGSAPAAHKTASTKNSGDSHRHRDTVLTHELLDFLALFSHQFRTPLSIIKGYIAMLLDGTFGELRDTQKKAFEKVFTATERMIRLVNNFLDLPRMHAGTMTFNLEPASLVELVAHAVAEARLQADIKKLPIEWSAPLGETPEIATDRENLLQALANILDNAIRYTRSGKIRVELSRKDNSFLVAICDTGKGIAKEDLPHLFNQFMRGQDMRALYREGRGLGLYITRRIIEGHGGRVWAESPGPGRGSTFYVELPVSYGAHEVKKS